MVFGSRCPICGGMRGCDRSEHHCYVDESTSIEMWKLLSKAMERQREEAKKEPAPHVENILEDL